MRHSGNAGRDVAGLPLSMITLVYLNWVSLREKI